MANHYRSVLASGGGIQPTGDAVAADVLSGKTFSNASAVGINGTMPNRGAVSGQATPSQPYTIPAGYHNGSGIVTAISETIRNINLSGYDSWSFKCAKKYLGNTLSLEFWGTSLGSGPRITVTVGSTTIYNGTPQTSHQTQSVDLSAVPDSDTITISTNAGSGSGNIFAMLNQ